MNKYIVAGNWKMNGSKSIVKRLLGDIKMGAAKIAKVEWIVFPSYPFLAQAEDVLEKTNISWGAQNLSDKTSGAYTGEISAAMLRDFGCRYVLVGHSERRHLYGEDNELVARKFQAASEAGLIPILCVGETLQERELGFTKKIIGEQILAVLNLANGIERMHQAIIAYEPVWAIGTGVTATPEQAQVVHAQIRQQIAKYDVAIAEKLQILYGGSVKPSNAKELFAMADINGGLIGGASLNASDFLEIGKLCNN